MSRRLSLLVLVALAAVIAAGCAGSGAAGVQSTKSFSFTQFATGFDHPVFVTSAPGDADTLYVVEQPGTIKIVQGGTITGTFLDISGLVAYGGERGLLSMAFSPKYATNHLFYVSYTDVNGNSRVASYQSSGGIGVRFERAHHPRPPPAVLRITTAASSSSTSAAISTSASATAAPAAIRSSTPRTCTPASASCSARRRRRPTGSGRSSGSGCATPGASRSTRKTNNLWIGDVGQNTWEEVDFRAAPSLDQLANYGWSRYEGYSVYDANHTYTNKGQKVKPVLVYGHVNGQCAVMGGYVYRGSAVPAAQGRYFYGDECTGSIWSFNTGAHGRTSPAALAGNVPSLSSFGTDGHGELYAVSLDGTLYKLG